MRNSVEKIKNLIYILIVMVSCSSKTKNKAVLVEKHFSQDSTTLIKDSQLFDDHWDSLPQVLFWKQIMTLSPDSCIVNHSETREIVYCIPKEAYFDLGDSAKLGFKETVIEECNYDSSCRLYVTTGKNHFYQINKVIPSIDKAIPVFEQNEVDPWFAQAILLIESPAALYKSPAGAYGNFQIMAKVARKYGLVVNKYKDERKDLEKSAMAASRLIKEVCVPYAKQILDNRRLAYTENDLYFKLLVLHIYHAGAANVMQAVDVLDPKQGGQAFIQGLWKTEAGRFKNASQNYSQVALAALVILHECCI